MRTLHYISDTIFPCQCFGFILIKKDHAFKRIKIICYGIIQHFDQPVTFRYVIIGGIKGHHDLPRKCRSNCYPFHQSPGLKKKSAYSF
ncbi:hypothetical protein SDC9_200577 [bioreactor metagenome]|uniref:Uncharacterized protein n=1 Tax=bioreactor metagenome TaxID=1076179 RepID=A0A645IX17_9ZZZZ